MRVHDETETRFVQSQEEHIRTKNHFRVKFARKNSKQTMKFDSIK
jgi:hypothetical protein